ncbi:SDR family NAD(P)-dependent oxidoreductase [Streptomyces sp. NPDC004752]
MNTLQNRVALVTGSSRGIGAGIAELFAAEGARVVLHGRDIDALESVRAKIAAAGGDVLALTADLTRFDEIEALRTRVEAEFGPVDILVTNAGGNPVRPGPIEEISEEGWHASIDANLTSTFLTVKSFLPGMKERGHGSIVTLSSAAARRPTLQSPFAYVAAKAGVELLTKGLAVQAGPHGIRVNCIAPETIMTERNERQIPAAIRRALVESHPVRRLGTPEDVAQAALFLAADSASWISGVVLDVAGGSVLV